MRESRVYQHRKPLCRLSSGCTDSGLCPNVSVRATLHLRIKIVERDAIDTETVERGVIDTETVERGVIDTETVERAPTDTEIVERDRYLNR